MLLNIVEIHPAESAKALNTEWFVLENASDKPFSTKNCSLAVTRKNSKKRKELGTLDPGFIMAPGEKVRLVTGNPGRKAHGAPPTDDLKNYNLFLGDAVLRGAGTMLVFSLRSLTVAEAIYDPEAKGGVAEAEPAAEPAE